jgi:hypothetical protein
MGLWDLFPVAALTSRFTTNRNSILQGAPQYVGDPKNKKSISESLDKRLES